MDSPVIASELYGHTESAESASVAQQIKAAAEVEKIWILYNLRQNETLGFLEVRDFLLDSLQPENAFTDKQIEAIYESIDVDRDGSITKQELEIFVKHLMASKGANIRLEVRADMDPATIAMRSAARRGRITQRGVTMARRR